MGYLEFLFRWGFNLLALVGAFWLFTGIIRGAQEWLKWRRIMGKDL